MPALSAIVPTLGTSPYLRTALEALRGADGLDQIILVDQGPRPVAAEIAALASRVLRLDRNLGFAAANNLAMRETRHDFVATVNDDAIVDAAWTRELLAALAADPTVGAVQGTNLCLDQPTIVDGRGLEWNRGWQAVQIDRGRPAGLEGGATEVFGVSATAAVYRRQALDRVGLGASGQVFDERLGSYYEDVDLACRLRGAGWRALTVPTATARHAGSTSGRRLALGSWPLIYGNRWLVLARLLGRAMVPRLPAIAVRDISDLWHAGRRGRGEQAAGIVAGWLRALRLLPRFAHLGPPLVAPSALRPPRHR